MAVAADRTGPGGTLGAVSRQIRFGYKVSAEQFGPSELLEFAVVAESAASTPPRSAITFNPGGTPLVTRRSRWRGWRRPARRRAASRSAPASSRPPSDITRRRGPRHRHPRLLFPGSDLALGVGTGESMNEAPLGIEWPDPRSGSPGCKEAVALIQTLWMNDRVSFDGTYYRDAEGDHLRSPEDADTALHRCRRTSGARFAGRVADGFICTSGKGMELYSETLLPAVAEGAGAADRDLAQVELTIEMKVSFDTDRDRALEDTRNWAALALSPEEKTGVEDAVEMERLPTRCPPTGQRAGGSSRRIRMSMWNGSVRTSTSASPISSFTRPAPISAGFSSCTLPTCSRAFAVSRGTWGGAAPALTLYRQSAAIHCALAGAEDDSIRGVDRREHWRELRLTVTPMVARTTRGFLCRNSSAASAAQQLCSKQVHADVPVSELEPGLLRKAAQHCLGVKGVVAQSVRLRR